MAFKSLEYKDQFTFIICWKFAGVAVVWEFVRVTSTYAAGVVAYDASGIMMKNDVARRMERMNIVFSFFIVSPEYEHKDKDYYND